jgi:hypothetical protein
LLAGFLGFREFDVQNALLEGGLDPTLVDVGGNGPTSVST